MRVQTKYFGEIDLATDKIITFEQGIIGFEHLKKFALLYDLENEKKSNISWLQSLDEAGFALPVINPFLIHKEYHPDINDDSLLSLGEMKEESMFLFVTLTVPTDITKMSCNLKAPFIINGDTHKGCQVIVENNEYPVKYYIYDILQADKVKGEKTC